MYTFSTIRMIGKKETKLKYLFKMSSINLEHPVQDAKKC